MTEEKRNKILAALTVNAVLLFVVLLIVWVYQLITIVVLINRKANIQQQITQYEEQINNAQSKLEEYQTEEWLRNKAYEYGFVFPGED